MTRKAGEAKRGGVSGAGHQVRGTDTYPSVQASTGHLTAHDSRDDGNSEGICGLWSAAVDVL